MLTLCRTLMGDPDLIIIDEPTEGLAPKIVELVGQYLKKLKERGISVLLIEQKLTIAMAISDRALVMGHGSIVFQGTPDSLRADAVYSQGVARGIDGQRRGPAWQAECRVDRADSRMQSSSIAQAKSIHERSFYFLRGTPA